MHASVTAEEFAQQIHRRARIIGPPFDMEAVALAVGCEVDWVDPSLFGGAVGCSWGRRILLSSSGTPGRDAWTIAHELAHIQALEAGIAHDERFADAVAAELLMPRRAFEGALSKGMSLPRLAELFGASFEATARRILEVTPSLVVIVDAGGMRKAYRSAPVLPPLVVGATYAVAEMAERAQRHQGASVHPWVIDAWATPQGGRSIGLALERT